MATKDNVLRILKGIGCPKEPLLKIVVFYCHANANSPIDQNDQDFITDDTVSVFNGWGVYCIGCDVARNLSHNLLAAGADFLIAFNSPVMVVLPHADEIYAGLNSGILRMLREEVGPLAATEHMRQFFLDSITRVDNTPSEYSLARRMALRSHAKALEYHGSKREEDHYVKASAVNKNTHVEHSVKLSQVKNKLRSINDSLPRFSTKPLLHDSMSHIWKSQTRVEHLGMT